jgi:two-component system cell cycle sensor histidine kinase/response regulator CckA
VTVVLIVEDEPLIARDLARTLRRLGYQVAQTASSAGEALRAMAAGPPALVLMDINLEGELDGIATAATIRRRWQVPIVYLTSHSDDATLARAKATGPHGYLLKPFNERDLRITIEVALHKHELDAEIARRERWFSTTLQSIGDAVIAADADDRITFMNTVAERLTGWPLQEAAGRRLADVFRLLAQDGEPMGSPTAKAMAQGFAIELPANTRLITRDDRHRDVDDSSAPIVDDRGQLLGGVVVFRDVTTRKRLERRAAQSERLAAVGTMASGMAHELNNPLAAVVMNLGVVVEGLRELQAKVDGPAQGPGLAAQLQGLVDALGDAQTGAERVTQIVRELGRFARTGDRARQPLDLPDVLDAAIAAVDAGSTDGLTIERRYGITPYVEANDARLLQVFSNLLERAIRAVANLRSRARSVVISTRTDDVGHAVVEVRDNGRGIPPDELPRIFDPFFAGGGLEPGSGTGFALGVCHGIVTALGGEITVESELDHGSVFRVTLPAARSTVAEASTVAETRRDAEPRGTGPRRRLLLIDDERDIGRVFERVLGVEHDVAIEHDPRAALARLQAGEHFDLVFCDVMMPGFSGVDLFRAVRASVPGLEQRIVFVTGGAVGDEAQAFLATTTNPVLAKPFALEELRALVRQRLAVHAA